MIGGFLFGRLMKRKNQRIRSVVFRFITGLLRASAFLADPDNYREAKKSFPFGSLARLRLRYAAKAVKSLRF